MAEKNLDLLDSHGVLNDMTDKAPKILDSERFNFLGTVRKETREILDKLRKAKKNAKFELSPNQIKNLRNKGYNVKIKTK